MKVLLVDGMFMVERCKNAKSVLGAEEQLRYFFLLSLGALASRFRSHALHVLWDGPNEWRKERCPAYKIHRTIAPNEDTPAVAWIKEALPLFGVTQVVSELEADDVAATLVDGYEGCKSEVLLYTTDRDWLQLVSDAKGVMALTPDARRGAVTLLQSDEAHVRRAWGVLPKKLVLLRALIGDGSDGLAGVPKIPRKLLVELCQACESVDEVIARSSGIKGDGWTENRQRLLRQSEELIRMNFDLMTLQTRAELVKTVAKPNRLEAVAKLAEIGAQPDPICKSFFGDGFGSGPLFANLSG